MISFVWNKETSGTLTIVKVPLREIRRVIFCMHVDKIQSPISYLAFGDSLTEGIGATHPDKHWVTQYYQYLRSSDQCSFRNFGVSGMTSTELFSFLNLPSVMRQFPRATHMTITTGGCDFIQLYEDGKLTGKHLIQTIKKVHDQVKQILHLIRSHNPHVTIHLLGFYLPLPAYQMGLKKATWFIQLLNKGYAKLCKMHQVNLINPFYIFLNRHDYFCDEVHPNQAGYDEIARMLIQSSQNKKAQEDKYDQLSAGERELPSISY
jgi:lysophospholipase L1-like esterase